MTSYKTPVRILLTCITILFAGFIFFNSLLTAPQSSAVSSHVLEQIQNFLHSCNIPCTITEHMIRKAAHFTEFLLFGVLVFWTIRSYSPRPAGHLFTGLFLGLAVPVTDEFLQLFVDGRGSQVSDVLLDFGGFLTGSLLFLLIFGIHKHRKSGRGRHLSE